VTRPNQVWAMDITYIPMARGFIYLAAVLDWFTRRALFWRVSITLEADFCIEAVEEALARHGKPEIFGHPLSWFASKPLPGNGSGQPIYLKRLHQGAGEPGDQDQHASRCLLANTCR